MSIEKVAILVDGGFYRKRATYLFGKKSPKERADELEDYCHRHLMHKDKPDVYDDLYRIFYYDCPPADKQVRHPLTKNVVYLQDSSAHKWTTEFFEELIKKRKFALRKGELLDSSVGYVLKPGVINKLCDGTLKVSDLQENDFMLDMKQKGVDMRVGLDIASLAHKKLVTKIILIAGDSDFVPAAKHARREGIDFVLDPMWQKIRPSLNEHIDGLRSVCAKPVEKESSEEK